MPEPEAMQYEKTLRKMATKGVVQLFNALRQAQKTAQEAESEGIQKNTAQVPVVSKKAFLQAMKEDSTPEIQKPAFLRDDFNTSAEKHWENADEVF